MLKTQPANQLTDFFSQYLNYNQTEYIYTTICINAKLPLLMGYLSPKVSPAQYSVLRQPLTWLIRYIYHIDLQFLSHVIIINTNVHHPQAYVTFVQFGYHV